MCYSPLYLFDKEYSNYVTLIELVVIERVACLSTHHKAMRWDLRYTQNAKDSVMISGKRDYYEEWFYVSHAKRFSTPPK